MKSSPVLSHEISDLSKPQVSQTKCSLLIVDDESAILHTLSTLLREEYEVFTAQSAREARTLIGQRPVDLVLSDQRMPGESGVELLEWVYDHHPGTMRLLMTGFAEFEETVDAINRARIFHYIFKPWKVEDLLATLARAAHLFRLERHNVQLLEQLQILNQQLEERVQERTEQLEVANRALEQKNTMLERLALTDPLTNLPNRRAMDRLVERELRRLERHDGAVAIGLLDIDHFKRVNSEYLLPGGDKVLVDFTKCVADALRTIDILGRVGGEEFLVLAPETDSDGAETLAERIRETVEQYAFQYKEHIIQITVSIGFAVSDGDVQVDYEQLRHAASAALAEAKMTGRNRCLVYCLRDKSIEKAM